MSCLLNLLYVISMGVILCEESNVEHIAIEYEGGDNLEVYGE